MGLSRDAFSTILLAVCSAAGAAEIVVDTKAYIDGRDRLILRGETLQWHHFDHAAVGRHGGANLPTIISTKLNGKQKMSAVNWIPDWPEPPPAQIRYEAESSVFDGLDPGLPSTDMKVTLTKLAARHALSIVQEPTRANGYTLITEFDDNPPGGPTWYEARLTIETPGTRVLCVGVDWTGTKNIRGHKDAELLCYTLKNALGDCMEANTLELDTDTTGGGNLTGFLNTFEGLASRANPGDTIILSFSSAGDSRGSGQESPFKVCINTKLEGNYGDGTEADYEWRTSDEYIKLSKAATETQVDRLYDDALRDLLADARLAEVRKIVILDLCRSGGFGPDLTNGVSNIAVLAACNEGWFAYPDEAGMGIFTRMVADGFELVGLHPRSPRADGYLDGNRDGALTLAELMEFIAKEYDKEEYFGDLIGKELPLRDLEGTGIFNGLEIDFATSADFVDDFGCVPEPGAILVLLFGALALRRRRRE